MKKLLHVSIFILISFTALSQEKPSWKAGFFLGDETGAEIVFGKRKFATAFSLSYYNLFVKGTGETYISGGLKSATHLQKYSYKHGIVIANTFRTKLRIFKDKFGITFGAGFKYRTVFDVSMTTEVYEGKQYETVYYYKRIGTLGLAWFMRPEYGINEQLHVWAEWGNALFSPVLADNAMRFSNIWGRRILKLGISYNLKNQ